MHESDNSDGFATIPDVPLESTSRRVIPNQIPTGIMRGVQQLGGENIVIDNPNNRILIKDGTNNRVIIGLLPDGTYGMAVSKPGNDVIAAFT